jgi:tetraacyldisaccharide 4'-kinase
LFKYFRLLLLPLSLHYALHICIKNKLYDLGFLKSIRVSKPLISIGNISTGGTGKTPFVIYLAEYFLKKQKSVAIISRGYKRDSKDLLLVYDGKKTLCSVKECGDELFMATEKIKLVYKNFFVAACNDRVKAAEMLIKNYSPDVILLDDGFQHRRISRDLDIVLIDAQDFHKNKIVNSVLLPCGNLRESFGALKRSDIVIQNNKTSSYPAIAKIKKFKKEIVTINYKVDALVNHPDELLKTEKDNAVAFSGIANTDSFYDLLSDLNINIKEKIKFKDHQKYTLKDINFILSKFKSDYILITTEKDFVKIKEFEEFINNYPVYYLKLNINILENSDILEKRLEQIINA